MTLPEPKNISYKTLVSDIERGLIKIPQFQRDFVWSVEKSAALIDSILKGYPIGSFITWKTKEYLRIVRNLGNIGLPPVPEGDFTNYVLDGQQRMTSLFCAMRGVKVERENRIDDFSEIYVDLNASGDKQIVKTDISNLPIGSFIRVTDLIRGSFQLLASYAPEYHEKLSDYKATLEGYNFSCIEIREASLDVATEIFTRINVGGKPLTVFEIMVAKTFDANTNFDLAERYDELIDRLAEVGYNTISETTILQTVSLIISKECTRQDILRLHKNTFLNEWPKAVSAIEAAVDYFRGYYRIPVSQLLPYNILLAPFAYFFYHHPDKPTGDKQRYLQDFFWRCSLCSRYSSSVESKLSQDIRRIDKILNSELPEYETGIDASADFINANGWFNTGRGYIKALLCILAFQEPKSFVDGAIVHISNDWLKRANSRNYHHFFPKAYLRREKNLDEADSNHIANITIVDDFLNKRLIGANPPSRYMQRFTAQNIDLAKHMSTHLIELDGWGVFEDDYETFRRKRCERLAMEISSRIILQRVDVMYSQRVNIQDFDEASGSNEENV